MKQPVKAIFAGSFDPFTYGHNNLIDRASLICDELIIGIGNNAAKKTLFSLNERIVFIRHAGAGCEIKAFSGLLADFAIEEEAQLLIRGVRSAADYEYEMTMAQVNKELAPDVETILLPADPTLSLVSSSLLKELAKHKSALINKYCSKMVADALFSKF